MDIALTPDSYTPSIDDNGNYIDNIPIIKNGIYCLCGSRKDKVYDNKSNFSAHIKTQRHQKWLVTLNYNKANFYVEMMKNKELVENQQKIIVKLENQLQIKSTTIDYLTKQLTNKNNQTSHLEINLIDI